LPPGRGGGSIQECLASQLPAMMLNQIQLGLYNGGWIDNASGPPAPPKGNERIF